MTGGRVRSTGLPSLVDLRARDAATISVAECAALLQVSRGAAFTAVHSGQLPSVKIGRRILIPVPALLRLLEAGGS